MPLIDGPLIDIEIPETDDWEDSFAARVLFIATALLLFRMGFRLWASLMPEYWLGAVGTVVLFAVGTQLILFSASDLDLERWGPWISYAVLAVVATALVASLYHAWISKIGTDAMLFSRVGVEALVDHGRNPYRVDMRPHITEWRGPQYSTPRIDGGVVHQLSYPAGAVLWFVPQYATVGETPWGIRLTTTLLAIASAFVVVRSLPPALSIAGIVAFLGTRNLLASAAGGIIWPLWLFPLLLGFRAWADERWLTAAAWIGLSTASKQFAWIILPFLAIWQWHVTPDARTFARRAARMIAVGGVVFLAINGPFIVWDASAWMDGVLKPVSNKAPLIHQGAGLAVLAFAGVLSPPTWWFNLAVACATVTALATYWLYFDRLKWVAWVVPPAILFFHTRSLLSYFSAWAPLALLETAACWGRLRTGPLLAPARRRVRERVRPREVSTSD